MSHFITITWKLSIGLSLAPLCVKRKGLGKIQAVTVGEVIKG